MAHDPLLGRSGDTCSVILGALGARLRLAGSLFGALGASIGLSWVVLGNSWGGLRRSSLALGRSRGAQGLVFFSLGMVSAPQACVRGTGYQAIGIKY